MWKTINFNQCINLWRWQVTFQRWFKFEWSLEVVDWKFRTIDSSKIKLSNVSKFDMSKQLQAHWILAIRSKIGFKVCISQRISSKKLAKWQPKVNWTFLMYSRKFTVTSINGECDHFGVSKCLFQWKCSNFNGILTSMCLFFCKLQGTRQKCWTISSR